MMDRTEACLRRLDIALDGKGWDKPPVLCTLRQPVPGKRVTATPIDDPDAYWADIPQPHGPAQKLWLFAERHQGMIALMRTPDLIGWCFAYEAWEVQGGAADKERLLAAQRRRQLHTVKNKVEVRNINACLVDGRELLLHHYRGSNDEYVTDTERGWDAYGAIASSLRVLCGLPPRTLGEVAAASAARRSTQ